MAVEKLKAKRVYCFRVDENDIRSARRLRIKLGPALRAYIKVLITKQLTLAAKGREDKTKWTIKTKQS